MSNEAMLAEVLRGMTPQQRQVFEQASTIDPEAQALQDQLAQHHQAQMQMSGKTPYGAGAGIMNGVGQIAGALRQRGLREDQQANIQRQPEVLKALLEQLRNGGAAPAPAMAPAGDQGVPHLDGGG